VLSIVKRFGPQCVVYIRTGGRPAGTALAATLGIPCYPLDIRYPHSRWMERCPIGLRPLLFLVKELLYRISKPVPRTESLPTSLPVPLILVDDRCSSGKTLRCALLLLSQLGISRDQVLVAVERCGRRAKSIVDVPVQSALDADDAN
jgi:hypothetical protein